MKSAPDKKVQLRFDLDSDVPEYQQHWTDVQYADRNELIDMWKSFMKLPTNKKLSNYEDVGLPKDYKQVCFEKFPNDDNFSIIIGVYTSHDDENRWDSAELLDLKDSFVKVLNKKVGGCCKGIVILI